MKRFIQQIKERTGYFDDSFPCKLQTCDKQHVKNWLKMYLLYLHMKTERVRFVGFVTTNGLKLTEPIYSAKAGTGRG
jgi:hypothetical protein